MEIKKITIRKPTAGDNVALTSVGSGYLQGDSGSLPDVDIDFPSDRRLDVKEYLEKRWDRDGVKRVFAAGTLHTLKIKAAIKDLCNIHGVPRRLAEDITALIKDGDMTWTGLMLLAFEEKMKKGGRKMIYNFLQSYPEVALGIRHIMGQPRSSSVHASAIIITPDHRDGDLVECYDFLPIKKTNGVLTSEIDGYSIDDIGLLKNDVLSTIELSQTKDMIDIVRREYGDDICLYEMSNGDMDDQKTYELLSNGYTQNVFQFSSPGMTRFISEMKPSCFGDLVAATSLFRPASLSSGSADRYNDCKHGIVAPTYLWGTYEILKETHGVLAYQEQLAFMARKIGGFTTGEGVGLVKLISKKNTEKIHAMKDKFLAGAKANGCPDDDAKKIWEMIESGGSYLFNKSHATAYSMISYIGAYIKANYPTAFYTVSLDYANDKKLPDLMAEIPLVTKAGIVAPDINVSGAKFITDYEEEKIYWSLSRISHIGEAALSRIMKDREVFGEYKNMEDFMNRIFVERITDFRVMDFRHIDEEVTLSNGETFENGKEARKYLNEKLKRGYPEVVEILNDIKLTGTQWDYIEEITTKGVRNGVDTRHMQHLIISGCFDNTDNIKAVADRWVLIKEAADTLRFDIDPKKYPEDLVLKHYFWSSYQIEMSGVGNVDYKRIYNNHKDRKLFRGDGKYLDIPDIEMPESDGRSCVFCATVQNIYTFSYNCKRTGDLKTCGRIVLHQNKSSTELVIWSDQWEDGGFQNVLVPGKSEGVIIIGNARVQYNAYQKKNTLNSSNNSKFITV